MLDSLARGLGNVWSTSSLLWTAFGLHSSLLTPLFSPTHNSYKRSSYISFALRVGGTLQLKTLSHLRIETNGARVHSSEIQFKDFDT